VDALFVAVCGRRLIWLGNIGFFQVLELIRYLNGQTYRPFFALYAAALFALVAWFAAEGGISHLSQSRETLTLPSPGQPRDKSRLAKPLHHVLQMRTVARFDHDTRRDEIGWARFPACWPGALQSKLVRCPQIYGATSDKGGSARDI
jgi:hypothetical protein